ASRDVFFFFFQAEDGIRDRNVTGVQTCALPILPTLAQKSIYACAAWEGTLGNPVSFPRSAVEELMRLEGDCGGKKVLRRHLDERSEERRVGKECRTRGGGED